MEESETQAVKYCDKCKSEIPFGWCVGYVPTGMNDIQGYHLNFITVSKTSQEVQ